MNEPASTCAPRGQTPIMLGLETSCDETAAAVVAADGCILAERVRSQHDEHAPFGGVVPEIAARAHVEVLDRQVAAVLDAAELSFADLSGVAATTGPGLIGGLMVGAVTGKALAAVQGLPFYAVNHLAAHVLTPRLVAPIAFPYLVLLVSGGHTQLVLVRDASSFERLGTTIDDAAGEAFDKIAKALGLGYPGGPALERLAAAGNPEAIDLPRPLKGRPGCHFSFSGLKTAVLHALRSSGETPRRADIAASFQAAVADSLVDRTGRALDLACRASPRPSALAVVGGVAANAVIRKRLDDLAETRGMPFLAPPLALCGDNAAMVAWAALERSHQHDPLDAPVRARWPLDPDAEPAIGAGIKG